jgi:glycosyltransferase involved in cell wall biosynthesis
MRFVHAWRYRRAGLRRIVREIAPDVFHAHYAVEHGFYGAFVGFHPYVVSAWGSDLLVESHKALGGIAARYALRRADLVTANDPSLARRAVELGVAVSRVEIVRLGIDAVFFETSPSGPLSDFGEGGSDSDGAGLGPMIISDRALEPLYNVDVVLRAFAVLRREMPEARLVVAHEGSEAVRLRVLAARLGVDEVVRFVGRLESRRLASALRRAQVYVSVPDSESFALSTLEAMASGCFPIVSDLPSVKGMIEDGVNGLLVRPGDVKGLAVALRRALSDGSLRERAAVRNRALAEAEGDRERNMLVMEGLYYRLAGVDTGSLLARPEDLGPSAKDQPD